MTFDLLTTKLIGVFYSIRAITLWSLKALGQRVLELLSGNGFHSSGHCDLDLWSTDPKINRGLLLNKGYHPMNLKALGQRVLELLSGNGFHTSGHCDLDLWPTDPKINRGLLLKKGYHPMKSEGSGWKGTRVIERKRSVTDGRTDRRTDGRTDGRTRQKQYVSPRGGRHKYRIWYQIFCKSEYS